MFRIGYLFVFFVLFTTVVSAQFPIIPGLGGLPTSDESTGDPGVLLQDLPSIGVEATVGEASSEEEVVDAGAKQSEENIADSLFRDTLLRTIEGRGEFDTIQLDTGRLFSNSEMLNSIIDSIREKRTSKIYGHHLFQEKRISYTRESKSVKVSNNYIVGPGDELGVAIWGQSSYSGNFEVNNDGYIKPNEFLPRIQVSGLTFEKAKALIINTFSRYYVFNNDQIDVNLQYSKELTINIVGEVYKAGTMSVPAVNTLVNLIALADGVTDLGSVRNIQMYSNGKSKQFDLYKYLKSPNYKDDFYLSENDYVLVPVIGKVVEISGSVKRPFKYELLDSESLADLIEFAGGLKSNTANTVIKKITFKENKKVIENISITSDLSKVLLKDGDQVVINSIDSEIDDFVSVIGAVRFPEHFAVNGNVRLSDVLKSAELLPEARTDLVYVKRVANDGLVSYVKVNYTSILSNLESEDNIKLKRQDEVIVFSKNNFTDKFKVSIKGSVRKPGTYDFYEGLRVSDVINLSNGLEYTSSQVAYLDRTLDDLTLQTIKLDIHDIVNNPGGANDLLLVEKDLIKVFDKNEFFDGYTIDVHGAVRSEGEIEYSRDLTLRDVILKSGGFKLEAANYHIEISRVKISEKDRGTSIQNSILGMDREYNILSGKNITLEPFDQIFVRTAPDFEMPRIVELEGEVVFPGKYALLTKTETLSDLISRAGGLTQYAFVDGAQLTRTQKEQSGKVIMQLGKALNSERSKYNYVLKEGDKIEIPKTLDLVTLKGAFKYFDYSKNPGSSLNVPHYSGRSARYYLRKYGAGLDKRNKAFRRFLTVEYPNGHVKKAKNYVFFNKFPMVKKGSVVVSNVKQPRKQKEGKVQKSMDEFFDIYAKLLTNVTAFLTLILLTKRITD